MLEVQAPAAVGRVTVKTVGVNSVIPVVMEVVERTGVTVQPGTGVHQGPELVEAMVAWVVPVLSATAKVFRVSTTAPLLYTDTCIWSQYLLGEVPEQPDDGNWTFTTTKCSLR